MTWVVDFRGLFIAIFVAAFGVYALLYWLAPTGEFSLLCRVGSPAEFGLTLGENTIHDLANENGCPFTRASIPADYARWKLTDLAGASVPGTPNTWLQVNSNCMAVNFGLRYTDYVLVGDKLAACTKPSGI